MYGDIRRMATDYKRIGKKIRKLKLDSDYTNNSLAAELGVNRRTVITWETADAKIPLHKLQEVADIFNVNINYFFI